MELATALETEAVANCRDAEWARRCARGDEQALRLLFAAHEPTLRRLIYRVVGSHEDAEELSAETFMRFWRTAHRFRGEGSIRAYLARIALNLARDRLRRGRREPLAFPAAERDAGPEADEILAGLASLGIEDRELLTMYYLNEWTYEEICQALGIRYDVLRTRLVRARKRLKLILGVEDERS